MKIAVLREIRQGETRVAATPETVKKLVNMGCSVCVETNAGKLSNFSDELYAQSGADITSTVSDTLKDAKVILKVACPVCSSDIDEVDLFAEEVILIANLQAYSNPKVISKLAEKRISAFALELMPRITRAQSMDILSSQSNLSGYKAIVEASSVFNGAMPMMMTAAGTIAPARVLVFGAGVAGLQAIATAKRLGAVVLATDVRYAAKEQVESLGGKFIVVDEEAMKAAETDGGYAREMSEDFKNKQAEAVRKEVIKSDIIVTTALIPGRDAPTLVTKELVERMKTGSVIVDLAVEAGGNVEGSVKDKVITTENGVIIIGHSNMPALLSRDASSLFARNILNFINLIINKDNQSLEINWEDEIIKGTLVTRNNAITNTNLKK
ncbi:MAG: NAD(P) transhydrogenase subunit alpha [Alphaproteobacteria bacterium TMED87]|nr:NAD(P)(+) transhydrogenase (Re/Si-specific) subunit alpha [Rhodospirillaceae bacterium]OUV10070.1 MAG: NAD(P) transhydrogenase subunit alpha [Alphaproteobacteria bacterium TMED87]